jgi:hypothetical protein
MKVFMQIREWLMIGIALLTITNGWAQFWVKERLFTKNSSATDTVLSVFKSKTGISFIALTGITSAVSILFLLSEVMSNDLLTRVSCFKISVFTVLSLLNIILVHSLFTLRRLAILKEQIENAQSEGESLAFFMSMIH